jgi:mono/diheme cytochrome c family protein
VLLVVLSAPLVSAAPPAQTASGGEAIFQQKCTPCHTIGGGRLVGPDLKGVTALRDHAWLVRFISGPDKVLAARDPIAIALLQESNNVRMPNLGLSADQVTAVIAFLESQGGSASPTPANPTPAAALAAGDPARGEALFAGNVHFTNGGPPCLACHAAGSTGLLGGGVLGPDLTQVVSGYGEAGLASALANIAWPTMAPIYARHRLTQQEQADLLAFLQAASSEKPTNRELPVLALSLAGLFAVLIAIGFLWRHRLRGVRRPLVERARTRKAL